MIKIYKIVNTNGMFSTGGGHPEWSKKGKSWTSLGHVHCHLSQCNYNIYQNDDAHIIEYVLEPRTTISSVREALIRIEKNKSDKRDARMKEVQKRMEEQERQKLKELKKKYEGL
jgi:hypothetical protein